MKFGPWVFQLLLNSLFPFCSRKRCVINIWIECKKWSLAEIGLRILFLLWFKHAIQFWNNDNSKATETVRDGAPELHVCSRAEVGSTVGTRGVATVLAGKWAAALWHPSEEGREGWVVPSQEQGARLQSELVKCLSSGHDCLVPSLCWGWLQDQAKAGPQSQGGKAKALNLSCGGADFELYLWEGKGLQSTAVWGDGLVPLLWKAVGGCLKLNICWWSAEHCVWSGLCLWGVFSQELCSVSLRIKRACLTALPQACGALMLWTVAGQVTGASSHFRVCYMSAAKLIDLVSPCNQGLSLVSYSFYSDTNFWSCLGKSHLQSACLILLAVMAAEGTRLCCCPACTCWK